MMTKPKTKTETKVNPKIDFMPHWKDEEKCYEDAKMEGFKDDSNWNSRLMILLLSGP
jgi:hypothetical protein